MFVYRDRQFRIGRKHPLYGCCDTVTALCCNLENAVRFRQRQLLAVVKRGDIPKKSLLKQVPVKWDWPGCFNDGRSI